MSKNSILSPNRLIVMKCIRDLGDNAYGPRIFEAAEAYNPDISLETVYITLNRLEDACLIEQQGKPARTGGPGRPRKVYMTTAAGDEATSDSLCLYRRIVVDMRGARTAEAA